MPRFSPMGLPVKLRPLLLLPLLFAPGLAQAHVVARADQTVAGSYSAVSFRLGHGCKGGAATVALKVTMPEGLGSARPQPKAGWTIEIEKSGDRVAAITWKGRLPDDQFDDFAVLVKLPAAPGPIYFPAVQTCEAGESAWDQIPAAPDMTGLERPAPVVTVIPAGAAPEHHH